VILVISFILLLLAGLCFALAAAQKNLGTVNLIALGLLFWVAVPFIQVCQRMADKF